MVRRIVAILLVGGWQLQATVPPHIHVGMGAAELIAHGQHRHVHLAHESAAHHDHTHHPAQHEDAQRTHNHGHSHPHALPPQEHFSGDLAAPPADHDDDAVYLNAGSAASVTRTSPHHGPLASATFAAPLGERTASFERHTSAPPRYGGQVPAFLSTTRLLL